jgi:hypothetical protein
VEFAASGGCVQVEEWVLPGLGRQPEEMCSERRPRWLVGEVGDDLVGLAIERLNDLGSDELLGRDMEPVGVVLNGVEQPGSRVAELAQQCCGGGRGVVAGEDLLQGLGRCARCDGLGSDEAVRVAVADDLQVDVVGLPSAG